MVVVLLLLLRAGEFQGGTRKKLLEVLADKLVSAAGTSFEAHERIGFNRGVN